MGRPELRVVGVRDDKIAGAEVPCIRYTSRDAAITQRIKLISNEDIVDEASQ